MIITAQPFFNELDLFEIKCRELAGVVDLHVVVEARLTFMGQPKPLHFAENAARFREFPIKHCVTDLPVDVPSPWDREQKQHAFLRGIVRDLAPEIVMFLDADEIPRASTVERFRRRKLDAAHIDMDWVTFFFDRLDYTRRPTTGRIWRFDKSSNWGPWRGDRLDENPGTVIRDAGWHFDYFNFSPDFLANKLRAISHAADEGGDSMLKSVLRGEFPGLERTEPYPLDRLPRWLFENRDRFAAQFRGIAP